MVIEFYGGPKDGELLEVEHPTLTVVVPHYGRGGYGHWIYQRKPMAADPRLPLRYLFRGERPK